MIKDYEKLRTSCLEEVKRAGIKPSEHIFWMTNHRAKTRWGLCTKKPDGSFEIQIAERLLTDDRISEKACKETIIHEILHTCKGCLKHTGNWKVYAEKMNSIYGYHIKRVTSGTEKGVENHQSKSQPYKYIFICKKCGQQVLRKRESKFTRYYRNYTCGICGTPRAFKKYVFAGQDK